MPARRRSIRAAIVLSVLAVLAVLQQMEMHRAGARMAHDLKRCRDRGVDARPLGTVRQLDLFG